MKLLQYVIIFVVIFYGLRLLFRLLLPFLVQYLFKKTQQNMDNRYYGGASEAPKEEGEVTVKFAPEKEKGSRKDGDDGEYVDFEEVY